MDIGRAWWVWLALGLVLLAAEVMTSGFVLMFFGVGALVVGGLAAAGVLPQLVPQLVVFAVLSTVALLLFRRSLLTRLSRKPPEHPPAKLAGNAVLFGDLAPGASGPAEYQGAPWTARNVGDVALGKGAHADIVRVDGLTLEVKAAAARARQA